MLGADRGADRPFRAGTAESLSPFLLALALLLVVVALLADHFLLAVVGGGLVVAALAGWHVAKEEAV